MSDTQWAKIDYLFAFDYFMVQHRFALHVSDLLPSLLMDFDLNAALNNQQTYLCALAACPAPADSTPPPLTPSSGALAGRSATGPTTYQDLPPEVIQRIGDYVPIQDIGHFSAIDRHTYRSMYDRRLVWHYWQRANQATSLASVNQLLDEMERTLHQPTQQVGPIESLRRRLRTLPQAERVDAFKRVFSAANRLPEYGVRIQKVMLLTLRHLFDNRALSGHEFQELFDFVHAMAAQRGPEQENFWPELAYALATSWTCPFDAFLGYYQALFSRLPSLSIPEQAALIPVLCKALFYFKPREWRVNIPELHAALRERARQLPPSHQGTSVGALASKIWRLPPAEQFTIYAELRDWALSLPDDQWGAALSLPDEEWGSPQCFLKGLYRLPPELRAQEFALIEPQLARVPAAQREQVALGLLFDIHLHNLDNALAQRVWQQALSLLNGVDAATFSRFLCKLRENAPIAPHFHQWPLVKAEIIRFIQTNQFSEAARTQIRNSMPWLKSELP
ncbi:MULTISPECIES: hypothetical protein [Mycetohabitans]|nr:MULTISPECIES: hypothetical protein [Mycetohabitans]